MTQLENEGFQFDDLLPVEIIDCNNSKKRAAEILLQINSHYAKITNEGLDEFAAEFDVDLSTINTDFELPDIDSFTADFNLNDYLEKEEEKEKNINCKVIISVNSEYKQQLIEKLSLLKKEINFKFIYE